MTTGAPMFGGDLESTRARLRQLAAQAEQRTQQFAQVRDQIQGITVTEQSTSGAVRVTVQSSGVLTDLTLTDAISRMRPDQVAADVMRCIRKAQSRIADRVTTVVGENVPSDDPAAQRIVEGFREQFPPPEPEPDTATEDMRFGPGEPDSAPPASPSRPVRQPRPYPGDDDEGWDDKPILR